MAKPIDGTRIVVKARLTSGGIFAPEDFEGNKKYRAVLVLEENEHKKIEAIIKNSAKAKWGDKKPPKYTAWGAFEGDDPEFEASYGKWVVHPKRPAFTKSGAENPPATVVKRNGKIEPVTAEDGVIYTGCYVYVMIQAYSIAANPARKSPPCTALSLESVMFQRDGEPLGSISNPDKDFEDFESEESGFGDVGEAATSEEESGWD